MYMEEILRLEAGPKEQACERCLSSSGNIRCTTCFGSPLLCQACCLVAHQHNPFHHIEKWTSGFFKETTLKNEEFMLNLGHGGARCPRQELIVREEVMGCEMMVGASDDHDANLVGDWEDDPTLHKSSVLTVVHSNGVHTLPVQWCCCPGSGPKHVQLLRERLFPASIVKPSTAFTFEVLDYFHIDAVECKTSAMNFFSKLRRLTNYTSPASVPVSFPSLYGPWKGTI